MISFNFNSDWKFSAVGGIKSDVDLPHDAMIIEPRSFNNPSGRHCCFFKGNDYEYE